MSLLVFRSIDHLIDSSFPCSYSFLYLSGFFAFMHNAQQIFICLILQLQFTARIQHNHSSTSADILRYMKELGHRTDSGSSFCVAEFSVVVPPWLCALTDVGKMTLVKHPLPSKVFLLARGHIHSHSRDTVVVLPCWVLFL